MSIFGSIMSKIFHHDSGSAAPPPTQTASNDTAPPTTPPATPPAAGAPPNTPSTGGTTTAGAVPTPAPASQPSQDTSSPGSVAKPTAASSVDVGAVLDGLAAKNSQKLDWRHSIVDMMKLLDLDSSLTARKSLAQELHYSGSTDDSASMNIWLHKQVMQKLAENGGKVPADLKD